MVDSPIGPRRSRGARARWVLVLPLALALSPAARSVAADLEHLGLADSSTSLSPSCPASPCQVVTATTGFQAAITGRHNTMVVRRPGHVTSWSIALATPTPAQDAYFTRLARGAAKAGLVILHQGAAYRFRVIDASPLVALAPSFGRTATFDLARPLPVKPGDVVALTVPTWAPALAVALDRGTGWRASRSRDACDDVFRPTAQIARGALTKYQCVYHTARLTYGATVADDPPAAASPARPHSPASAPK